MSLLLALEATAHIPRAVERPSPCAGRYYKASFVISPGKPFHATTIPFDNALKSMLP